MRILSIDSSINDIGYSVMESEKAENPDQLIKSGTIRIRKSASDIEKVELIQIEIDHLFQLYPTIERALIEKATAFTYSKHKRGGKPMNSAGMNQNHFATGVIAGSVVRHVEHVEFLSAQDWKGMQKKIITLRLVNDIYKLKLSEKSDHNEADAIGIGRWYISQIRFQQKMRT